MTSTGGGGGVYSQTGHTMASCTLIKNGKMYIPFLDINVIHQDTVSQSDFVLNSAVGTDKCVFDRSLLTDYTLVSDCRGFINLIGFDLIVVVKSVR